MFESCPKSLTAVREDTRTKPCSGSFAEARHIDHRDIQFFEQSDCFRVSCNPGTFENDPFIIFAQRQNIFHHTDIQMVTPGLQLAASLKDTANV